MKKKVLITIMLMFPFIMLGQENDSIPSVTQAERIIDKYGGKIIDGFNKAVENVTPYAEEGFKMAVRLQIAKGIIGFTPLLALIPAILGLRLSRKNDIEFDTYEMNNWALLNIISWIAVAVFCAISIWSIPYGIKHLIAPEWFAIKEIMELVR